MASADDAFARYEQRMKEATASLAAEVAELRRQAAEPGAEGAPAAGSSTGTMASTAAAAREDKRQLLHEKVFVARESLLTHMLNGDESFRAIYNAMIAVLLWLGVKLVLQNWETQGRLLDVDSLAWAFGKVRPLAGVCVAEWLRQPYQPHGRHPVASAHWHGTSLACRAFPHLPRCRWTS